MDDISGTRDVGWASGGFLGPALVGGMVDVNDRPLMLTDTALGLAG